MPPEEQVTKESVKTVVDTILDSHLENDITSEKIVDAVMFIIQVFRTAARDAIDEKTTLENRLTELKEIAEDMKASLGSLGQPDLDSIERLRRWKEEMSYGTH